MIWFVIDLDGTLVDERGVERIPWLTRRVLAQARAAGHYVVLASGRQPETVGRLAQTLALASPWIALDGAWVSDAEGACVTCSAIDPAAVERLMTRAADCGIHWVRIPADGPVLKLIGQGAPAGFDCLVRCVPPGLRVASRYADSVELVADGVDKGRGLLALFRRYGRPGCVVAFGNDHNDIEMLAQADLALVMPTAPDPLLARADRVLGPIASQPVARAIDRIVAGAFRYAEEGGTPGGRVAVLQDDACG